MPAANQAFANALKPQVSSSLADSSAPCVSRSVYFGPADSQLYGVLHTPANAASRGAILICQSIASDAEGTSRDSGTTAATLGSLGFHVLTFDYFGTGNSQGSIESARLNRWQKDIKSAAQFLRARTSTTALHLLGFRFGALLASSARLKNLKSATLWEPVLSGADFLAAQHQLQLAVQKDLTRFRWKNHTNDLTHIGGLQLHEHMIKDLTHLLLMTQAHHLPEDSLIYRSDLAWSNKHYLRQLGELHKLDENSLQLIPDGYRQQSSNSNTLVPYTPMLNALIKRYANGTD